MPAWRNSNLLTNKQILSQAKLEKNLITHRFAKRIWHSGYEIEHHTYGKSHISTGIKEYEQPYYRNAERKNGE